MLSKKEFVKRTQGYFENDDCDIWVHVDGVYVTVPCDVQEKVPYENSEKLDSMPLEQAIKDETFDELYDEYIRHYSEGQYERKNLYEYLDHLISLEDPDFINDSWIDTTYRWLNGNNYELIHSFTFDDFEAMAMEIKETYKEVYEEDL